MIRAAMVVDGASVASTPGEILVDGCRIVAAGPPESIGTVLDCEILDLPDDVIIPALVNGHCHLDLSHIGPVPCDGHFTQWVDMVRARRAISSVEIRDSVRLGVQLSWAGGTAIIGDIAGVRSAEPLAALRESGLAGVSFVEVFGLGRRQADAVEFMRQVVLDYPAWENGVALGLQPHAPYSCGVEVYKEAARLKRPLATHLAETLEELTFVESARGPLADMIKRLGVWDSTITGVARHPVDHLACVFEETPVLAAHLNYIQDDHLEMLASWPLTVVYCPRASAYFGHPKAGWPAHRYRDMLQAGVKVALGTDSLLCLDTPDRLSVLDEMRFLYRRDGTDPRTLLQMGTVNGAVGLGFDPDLVTLKPGITAGLLAVRIDRNDPPDPLTQIMLNDEAPRWIIGPSSAHDRWKRSEFAGAMATL